MYDRIKLERRISMGSEKMPLQMLESPTTRVRCSTYVLEMRGDQEKRVKDYVYFYLDAFVVQGDKDIRFRGKKTQLGDSFLHAGACQGRPEQPSRRLFQWYRSKPFLHTSRR